MSDERRTTSADVVDELGDYAAHQHRRGGLPDGHGAGPWRVCSHALCVWLRGVCEDLEHMPGYPHQVPGPLPDAGRVVELLRTLRAARGGQRPTQALYVAHVAYLLAELDRVHRERAEAYMEGRRAAAGDVRSLADRLAPGVPDTADTDVRIRRVLLRHAARVAGTPATARGLIERSSLGTATARAHRDEVPAELGRAVARASTYLHRAHLHHPCPTPDSGGQQ